MARRLGLGRAGPIGLVALCLAAFGMAVPDGAPVGTVAGQALASRALTADLGLALAPDLGPPHGHLPAAEAAALALAADAVPPAAPVAAVGPVPALDVQQLSADGIPSLVLKAYQAAATREAKAAPACALTWPVLAGIGRVESDHGRDVPAGGGITPDGTIAPAILGPVLDGTNGTGAIPDPSAVPAGAPAGTAGWARAEGPMQFLSSTWQVVGVDGNGDGKADPNNVFDASLAAARYLCADKRVLSDPTALAAAVFSYNHSDDYVRLVLQLTAQYAHTDPTALLRGAGLLPLPTPAPPAPPAAGPVPVPPSRPSPTPPAPSPSPVAQTISFAALPAQTWPGTAVQLVATGGASGLPVTFTAGPAAVCTVAGPVLTTTGPGMCSVTAGQAGRTGFLAAPAVGQAVPVGYQVTVTGLTRPATVGQRLPVVLTLPGTAAPVVTATVVDSTPVATAAGLFARTPAGSYRWVLPTAGLAAGPHTLSVTISGDPTTHLLAFVLA